MVKPHIGYFLNNGEESRLYKQIGWHTGEQAQLPNVPLSAPCALGVITPPISVQNKGLGVNF